jgi:hypothetical protein
MVIANKVIIFSTKGLGAVSINIGPVRLQKIKVSPSSNFLVGIICCKNGMGLFRNLLLKNH